MSNTTNISSDHPLKFICAFPNVRLAWQGLFYNDNDRVAIIMVCLPTFCLLFGFWSAGATLPREEFEKNFTPIQRKNMSFTERRHHVRTKDYGAIIKLIMMSLFAWCISTGMHLLKLPRSVDTDAVGQWGPLVASLLVGPGAWVKAKLDVKEKPEDKESGNVKGNS